MNSLKTATMVCTIAGFLSVARPCAEAAEPQARFELEDVMQTVKDLQRRLDGLQKRLDEQQQTASTTPSAVGGQSTQARGEIEDLKAELARLQNRAELTRVRGQDVEVISTYLSVGLLAFGAIMLIAEFVILYRARRTWNELDFKIVITTLVVLMGVFLVVAGFSQEQITPVIGLLGAIVGYVLGKESFSKAPPATGGQAGAKDSDAS